MLTIHCTNSVDILVDIILNTMVPFTHFAYFQVVTVLNDLNPRTKKIYAYYSYVQLVVNSEHRFGK